jgi:CBS domain-containing protein
MNAKDIMTTQVATIRPETRIAEIASLLLQRRISGLPVVDDGRVVGMVSEGDLLRRYEIGTERKRVDGSWWMHFLKGDPGPADYVKSHAVRAADIMTHPAICITHDLPAARIAALFEKRRIKRVPVLVDDRLAGIVTRADLVRALAARIRARRQMHAQSDDAIRAQLLEELSSQAWWRAASNVTVTDGVVRYEGVYENDQDKAAARVAAENIPGVRRIEDHRISTAQLPAMG